VRQFAFYLPVVTFFLAGCFKEKKCNHNQIYDSYYINKEEKLKRSKNNQLGVSIKVELTQSTWF
jgi:hypothetical protein